MRTHVALVAGTRRCSSGPDTGRERGRVDVSVEYMGAKLEGFSRDGITFGSRTNATTGGANVEFPGGEVRLLVNYMSREIGEPGKRTGSVIGQAQVKL